MRKIRSRKNDPRSRIERARAERHEDNRERWTKRHPAAAAEQRQLRKARAVLTERWDHKNEGTAETHEQASRRHQGALAALYKTGAIDVHQLQAAAEIATVAERIGADVAVRTASLEARVDVTRVGDGAAIEGLSRVRREVAYTRWRAAVRGPIAAVLDMLIGEPVGFTIVAARYGMHHRRAKRLLIDALDLWLTVLGSVCKEIDERDLTKAQARLAA